MKMKTLALIILAAPMVWVTPTIAQTLAAHRAFYALEATKLDAGSGYSSIDGKLAYELTGNVCDGYSVSFRIVNNYVQTEKSPQLIDTQLATWESGDGLEMNFRQKQYLNSNLQSEQKLDVKRSKTGSEAKGVMTAPKDLEYTVPGEAVFPSTHLLRLIGDAEQPGPYLEALTFLKEFLGHDHGVKRIGVTAYPDGHALIERPVLQRVLHDKQAVLAEANLVGWASTQMCLDPNTIKAWLTAERAAGLTLPIHLGVPGVIDRTKLLTMGVRLGVGSSIRYASKNRGALGQLFSPGGYDPLQLLQPVSLYAKSLDIEALHVFTFNNVDATAAWRDRVLETPIS